MANFRPFYIPSCTAGMIWKVYFHKAKGYPAYVSAVEGELDDGFFRYMLHQNRRIVVALPGRATFKAVTDAGVELLRQMADNSYIAADAVDEYTRYLARS